MDITIELGDVASLQSKASVSYPTRESSLLDVLERDGDRVTKEKVPTGQLLLRDTLPKLRVIFAQPERFQESQALRQAYSDRFNIPEAFWTELIRDTNGSFGCKDGRDCDGEETYDAWLRFLVKHVWMKPDASSVDYSWYYIATFVRWHKRSGHLFIFCMGYHTDLQRHLQAALEKPDLDTIFKDPYALFGTIADGAQGLYDASIWSLRNLVRDAEKNRPHLPSPQPNYQHLHEIARHVIHSNETLEVAVDTMDSVIHQHKALYQEMPSKTDAVELAFRNTRRSLHYQMKMLKSLKARSQSCSQRLQNEINLAFNTVQQYESRISVQIGHAARRDSSAMKTISILTLVYLPGTFVSAIFSMSFFNFSPGKGSGTHDWAVSKDFWLYWAITIPLTGMTVLSWLIWQHRFSKKGV